MKILFTLALICTLSACDFAQPGTGDKIGQVAKVQTAGVMCDTTTVLVTGKFGGGELTLTVPESMVARVKAANESQEFVKVVYHTNWINSFCNNDTGNRWLDSVETHAQGAPEQR